MDEDSATGRLDFLFEEAEATQQLKASHRNFVEEVEPENEARRDPIRAVFGKDSIPEDSVF